MPARNPRTLRLGRAQRQKLYKSERWRKLRFWQLHAHPFCQCPAHTGEFVPAEVVDHIKPHRGDTRLFFNAQNLQSLSKACHDSWKQAHERSEGMGCTDMGEPEDKSDSWYG